MSKSERGIKIKNRFEAECRSPFPLGDVAKLRMCDPKNIELFHGHLEQYLSYIAGYASSADRLARRPRAELMKATEYLSQSFFDRYSSLAIYKNAITPESTPNLYHDLATAEELRKELLLAIDETLGGPHIR